MRPRTIVFASCVIWFGVSAVVAFLPMDNTTRGIFLLLGFVPLIGHALYPYAPTSGRQSPPKRRGGKSNAPPRARGPMLSVSDPRFLSNSTHPADHPCLVDVEREISNETGVDTSLVLDENTDDFETGLCEEADSASCVLGDTTSSSIPETMLSEPCQVQMDDGTTYAITGKSPQSIHRDVTPLSPSRSIREGRTTFEFPASTTSAPRDNISDQMFHPNTAVTPQDFSPERIFDSRSFVSSEYYDLSAHFSDEDVYDELLLAGATEKNTVAR